MSKKLWMRVIIITLTLLVCIISQNYVLAAINRQGSNKDLTKNMLVNIKNEEDDNKDFIVSNKIKDNEQLGDEEQYVIELDESEYEKLKDNSDLDIIEEDGIIQLLDTMIQDGSDVIETEFFDEKDMTIDETIETKDSIEKSLDQHSHSAFDTLDFDHIKQTLCSICGNNMYYDDRHIADPEVAPIVCINCSPALLEKVKNKETFTIETKEKSKKDLKNIISELELGKETTFNSLGDKIPWNISRTKANVLHDAGITGKNIKVAIFDTGIDVNHDLNIVGGVSFVDGINSYDDDNGHGTLMASIIASQLNGLGYVGVAPEVDLYAVKIFDQDGKGRYSNIIQGIYWAIENDINIISLGFESNQYSSLFSEAIKLAYDNNIVIIAAAGNSSKDEIIYSTTHPYIVSVGASDSNNDIALLSQNGYQIDFIAPGIEVYGIGKNDAEQIINGSSPASQHVAGVTALLWSIDSELTNHEVLDLLFKSTYSNPSNVGQVKSLINAQEGLLAYNSGEKLIDVNNDEYSLILNDIENIGDTSVQSSCNHNTTITLYSGYSCGSGGDIINCCYWCGVELSRGWAGPGIHPYQVPNYDSFHNAPWPEGHYVSVTCLKCGDTTFTGYILRNDCRSCTTAPLIYMTNKLDIIGLNDPEFKVKVAVISNDNYYTDTLFYINDILYDRCGLSNARVWQTSTFQKGISAANLPEGENTLKLVADPYVGPLAVVYINFLVDKSSPNVGTIDTYQTSNSIKLHVNNASDAIAGLSDKAYRYTVNGVKTEWMSSDNYTLNKLLPNTLHSYSVEVRDKKNNITTKAGSLYTATEKSTLQIHTINSTKITLKLVDNSPLDTKYKLEVKYRKNNIIVTEYVDSLGNLSLSESWYTINTTDRTLPINILQEGSYSITAYSKNGNGLIVMGYTLIHQLSTEYPRNFRIAMNKGDNIALTWDAVANAQSYKITRETLSKDGKVVDTRTFDTSNTYYIDSNIVVDTTYNYTIRQSGTVVSGSVSPKLAVRSNSILPIKTIESSVISSTVTNGEEFSIHLPVTNADINKYIFTLTCNSSDLTLLDACEYTKESESGSSYISDLNLFIKVNTIDGKVTITIIVDSQNGYLFTGIVNSLRFKSKVSGNVNITYVVSSR